MYYKLEENTADLEWGNKNCGHKENSKHTRKVHILYHICFRVIKVKEYFYKYILIRPIFSLSESNKHYITWDPDYGLAVLSYLKKFLFPPSLFIILIYCSNLQFTNRDLTIDISFLSIICLSIGVICLQIAAIDIKIINLNDGKNAYG